MKISFSQLALKDVIRLLFMYKLISLFLSMLYSAVQETHMQHLNEKLHAPFSDCYWQTGLSLCSPGLKHIKTLTS